MKYGSFVILVILLEFSGIGFSQVKLENPFIKYGSWLVLQAIPSPTFFEDRDNYYSRLKFGLEWQAIPVSYSFNANKYVSSFSFFFINPVKRFSGSVEAFVEPEVATGDFKYSDLKKFMYKTGVRFVMPAAQSGEYLAFSLGAGYYRQTTIHDRKIDGITYEAAVYSFFGMLGLKFNYNQNAASRYNIGVYLKYY
jgi:hypothetical protein